MTAGLILLKAYGSENQYLNDNPQMSYFTTVFKSYTNFSMENFYMDFSGTTKIQQSTPTIYRFEILRYADLLSHLYLEIPLPAIYSSKEDSFEWIKNLGSEIINSVGLYMNGQKIEELIGFDIQYFHRMSKQYGQNLTYNQMVGHDPNIYFPYISINGKNVYKESILGANNPPSIFPIYLRIPLIFSFSKRSGCFLPLIALQKTLIEVIVECKPLNDLYTIILNNIGDPLHNKRIKPRDNNSLNDFIRENSEDYIVPRLNGEYIFLDKDEQLKFAKNSHKYLIEQITRMNYANIAENKFLDLELFHPVKELVFYAQKTDYYLFNQWSNYGNSDYNTETFLKNNLSDFRYRSEFEIDNIRKQFMVKNNETPVWENLDSNIVNALRLFINNTARIDLLPNDYFSIIQPYQHHKGTTLYPFDENFQVLPYSFSLEPDEFQPSGSCNFTQTKRAQLYVQTKQPPLNNIFKITYYKIESNDPDITSNYRDPNYNTNINISNTNAPLLNIISLDSRDLNNKIVYGSYSIETISNGNVIRTPYPMSITGIKYNIGDPNNNFIIKDNYILLSNTIITLYTDITRQIVYKSAMIINGELTFTYVDPRQNILFSLFFISIITNDINYRTIVKNIGTSSYISIFKNFPQLGLLDINCIPTTNPLENTINSFFLYNIDVTNQIIYGKLYTPADNIKQYNITIRYGNNYLYDQYIIIELTNAPIKFYNISDKLWQNPLSSLDNIKITEPSVFIYNKKDNIIADPVNPINFLYRYNLNLHSISYNRLVIESGIGNLEFAY